jgi:hypothetical protein
MRFTDDTWDNFEQISIFMECCYQLVFECLQRRRIIKATQRHTASL